LLGYFHYEKTGIPQENPATGLNAEKPAIPVKKPVTWQP
jgi:hypothetical protein